MTATIAPHPPSRPRRRVVTAIGVILLLGGLSVIGYFAWQYIGTNLVAKHKQSEIKKQTKIQWEKGVDGDAIAMLRVKRFGSDYEVPIVKGFDDGALARGVGWDPKSEKPGQVGNFAIAGHRVTHGEPFSKFPKLKKGDLVVIETRRDIFTYRLRNSGTSITVPFTTPWPLWRVPHPDARNDTPTERLITLLTCSELFHTENRSVVIGELVKTYDKKEATTTTNG
ncbi:sortase [Aeromicrobium sp. NPDC092404]|uniref:sortase domain-containing protein n=1 Tax=Aeromicrobium sp. NPDC092404 TaxID=3154976 RepID=UPI00341D2FF1